MHGRGPCSCPSSRSRAVVLSALVLTRHVVTATRTATPPVQASDGLLGWDASWYRDIARHGYDGVAKEGLRFFPFLPILARVGSWLPGVSVRLALLLVVNACALAVGALMYELVRGEGRSDTITRRAVWIVYLAPSAFVLVMGYAEATLMTATLVALLALRQATVVDRRDRGRGRGAHAPGRRAPRRARVGRGDQRVASSRTPGEPRADPRLRRARRRGDRLVRRRRARTSVWAEHRSGDLFYPLHVQQASARRGGWIDPARAVWFTIRDAASGDHLTAGIHVFTVAFSSR